MRSRSLLPFAMTTPLDVLACGSLRRKRTADGASSVPRLSRGKTTRCIVRRETFTGKFANARYRREFRREVARAFSDVRRCRARAPREQASLERDHAAR